MAQGDVTGNVTIPKAKRGAEFDGVDDYVYHYSMEEEPSSYTCAAWVKPTAINTGNNVVVMFPRYYHIFGINSTTGKWIAHSVTSAFANNEIYSDNVATLGEWTHVLVTLDGDAKTLKMYINGVEQADTATDANILSHENKFIIGGRLGDGGTPANFFKGQISDVIYWNRSVTAAEALQIYQGKILKNGLIHRWKLDINYEDSIGTKDGTNNGSRLVTMDSEVASTISNARVTANDIYLIAPIINDKILSIHIEEA